jgi:hypothetical protein
VRERNPYKVLQVPRDADEVAIEQAYNRLFDRYESQAYAGDAEATRMLEELNRARDILIDPARRAALDERLSGSSTQASGQKSAMATMSRAAVAPAARPRSQATTGTRTGTQRRTGSSTRPRSVARQRSLSPVPLVVGGLVLLVVVAVAVYFISKNASGSSGSANPGAAVATVNGQPIYERDLNDRYERDKAQQMSEPLIASIAAEGGITATRMFDAIKQDALDKLINMEVIQQEARKEKLYPDAKTQSDLIEQAKQTDVQPGESFENSLKAHGLTEDQYNRNVITSAVYRVIASKYVPTTGSDSDRQTAFINWICKTREGYDVKIFIKFSTSNDNQPCSSGLPSDIDLTGSQVPPPPSQEAPSAVPSAQPTIAAPTAPRATP